jgi:ABC-type multidrug transport system ATPase subunit
MKTAIRVENLFKSYKNFEAVKNLSFSVEEGDVYGFLGQNGAGKSTTIRMLLGLIAPNSGEIEFWGKALRENRKSILGGIGAIIERPDLYKYLSAEDNLRIFARMNGMKLKDQEVDVHLEKVGLVDRKKSLVGSFSQGMKQRLGIAVALVHDPKIIILDEPTNGLDPQGIADMRNLILSLNKDHHKTILVSSHLLSEIELVANRMIIIHKGSKIIEGKVSELLDPAQTLVQLKTKDLAKTYNCLQSFSHLISVTQMEDDLRLMMDRLYIPKLVQHLVEHQIEVLSVQPRHSLEDYFIQLTQTN